MLRKAVFVVVFTLLPSLCVGQSARQLTSNVSNNLDGQTVSFSAVNKDRDLLGVNEKVNEFSCQWSVDFGKELFHSVQFREGAKQRYEFVRNEEAWLGISTSIEKQEWVAKNLSSYVDVNATNWRSRLGLGYQLFLFGMYEDSGEMRNFVELFKNGKVEILDDGLAQISIEKSDQTGKLLVDKSKGFLIIGLELNFKNLSQGTERIEYKVSNSVSTDGMWFPTNYSLVIDKPQAKNKLPDGFRMLNGKVVVGDEGDEFVMVPASKIRVDVDLFDIRKCTSSDFLPQARIEDGTPVVMQDATHLDFEWRDGKIVACTSEALDAMEAQKFKPGKSRLSSVLIGLLLFVVGTIAWYLRKNKK